MNNKTTFSRRTFLSGIAAAGAGTAFSAVKLPEIDLLKKIDESKNREIIENDTDPILLKRFIPRPKNIKLNDDREVIFDNQLTVKIELKNADNHAKHKTSDLFKQYFNVTPAVSVTQKTDAPDGEAYKIKAAGSLITLSASNFAGIRYACNTLRQLAEVHSSTGESTNYSIPETEIDDAPAMAFRGLHLCWFPETETIQIEQYIRWASYYKFNHIIIEFWATFPFSSHPEFNWQEYSATPADIRRLVKLGKELGITLIPQLNIFGHASGSRGGSGKHAPLDFYPEFESLFEPNGWVWCLSNPATRKLLTDIVLETLEAFDYPPFYHIGGDEADGAAECRLCRHADYKALLIDHLTYFRKLLAEKNCRMMMWHDMLIQANDPRWKGYVANGTPRMNDVLEALPKDIIICDWQYGAPKENETWPTMPYFKNKGFQVLACPWHNIDNIKSLGEFVGKNSLDGLLCTTWHSPSYNQMLRIMMYGALAAWSTPPYASLDGTMSMRHLRQIGWDIPIKKYQNTGIHEWQVRPDVYP
jgi:N-acetyl-beta-hexosaminidase